jgi:hypothetical protein
MRYFIKDCNGTIVGNPKGYNTFRGAQNQQNSHKSKTRQAIWEAFDARLDRANNHISSITLH